MTRIPTHALRNPPVRPRDVAEGSVLTVLRVPPELAGMRVDRFVQAELRRTSRTRAQAIIARSAYTVEGRSLRSGDRVKAEQEIALWRPPWDEEATDTELAVLYEDEVLLAVDKPAGTPVHPTARYYRSTVVKLLERDRPGQRVMLSHRLDRETSGVLLLAKSADADRFVKRQFQGDDPRTGKPSSVRLVDKRYLAVVKGWPAEDTFRVEKPLELDTGSRLGVKMRIAQVGEGLPSATACQVIARRVRRARRDGDGEPERYALVACALETGRQHQIRVHLASLGHPVVGDKLYGPDDRLFARGADGELTEEDHQTLELPRHALHAESLELEHPRGHRVRITSPFPRDLASFWDALDGSMPET